MNVLVDTCVWSLAFRKKKQTAKEKLIVDNLADLLNESRIKMIGPIRQELLSGIAHTDQFQKLKKRLEAFEDLSILSKDYERAAEMFNYCRKKGITGSHIDFLICSISERNQLSIFTTDDDFSHYAKHLPIHLFEPREINF